MCKNATDEIERAVSAAWVGNKMVWSELLTQMCVRKGQRERERDKKRERYL